MKKQLLLVLLAAWLGLANLAAQNWPAGVRSAAMGHASVGLADIWSSFNNQAGLAWLEETTVGAFYENRFLTPELGAQGAAFALPVKQMGTFGVNLYRFGYSNYNENKMGFAYSRKFGEIFSAGLQLNLHFFQMGEDFGSLFTASGELSFLVKATEDWTIAAHVFNPTRTPLNSFDREKIATIFRIGTAYNFDDKLVATAEMEKDLLRDPTVRIGLEYHLADPVYLRGGLNTNPVSPSFGLGLKLKQFDLDVASAWHQTLGFSPQVGLSYKFRKKK